MVVFLTVKAIMFVTEKSRNTDRPTNFWSESCFFLVKWPSERGWLNKLRWLCQLLEWTDRPVSPEMVDSLNNGVDWIEYVCMGGVCMLVRHAWDTAGGTPHRCQHSWSLQWDWVTAEKKWLHRFSFLIIGYYFSNKNIFDVHLKLARKWRLLEHSIPNPTICLLLSLIDSLPD
jgi:hypothetical protein